MVHRWSGALWQMFGKVEHFYIFWLQFKQNNKNGQTDDAKQNWKSTKGHIKISATGTLKISVASKG